MDETNDPRRSFTLRWLPWLVALAGLVLYLATLNRGITFANLGFASALADWDWRPALSQPLHYLLTYPIRWLPTAWQVPALNAFAAVCGALVLALLARCVALLPHDRTHEERQRERNEFALLSIRHAWLPPLLAALACGLHLGFWNNAVSGTGAMVELLVFAWSVRCLLEYRVGENPRWLYKLALVYGLGLANSYSLYVFLPLMAGAVVWTARARIFEFRVLGLVILCGLAGLSLYLVQPMIAAATSNEAGVTVWQALKVSLASQKADLLYSPARRAGFFIALISLLPLMFISVRWPAHFGDMTAAGNFITTNMFRLITAGLAVLCGWTLVQLPYGKADRELIEAFGTRGIYFLPLYFIVALCFGYFLGHILLVYGTKPEKAWMRPSPALRAVSAVMTVVVWGGLVALPVVQFWKHHPLVKLAIAPTLPTLASRMAEGLPAEGAVLLSDDAYRLYLMEAHFLASGKPHNHILIQTSMLQNEAYQRWLARRYPGRWEPLIATPEKPGATIEMQIIGRLQALAGKQPVVYLHPSVGYYFEFFEAHPRGLLSVLKPYPPGQFLPSPLSTEELQSNSEFWKRLDDTFLKDLPAQMKLGSIEARQVAYWLSRSLNNWAVLEQRAGKIEDAGKHFARAAELNPINAAALFNQEFNAHLRAGRHDFVQLDKRLQGYFAIYRSWEDILNTCGGFDDPVACHIMGQILTGSGLYRFAAMELQRARQLDPTNAAPEITMSQLNLRVGRLDETLRIVTNARTSNLPSWKVRTNAVELIRIEALVYFQKNDPARAEAVLDEAIKQNPKDDLTLSIVSQVYLSRNMFQRALDIFNQRLNLKQDNADALLGKSATHILLNQPAEAVGALNRLLQLQPENQSARFNRALALLQLGQLEQAELDYRRLLDSSPESPPLLFGMAEIAFRKKDGKNARFYYEKYLRVAPPGADERREVESRLVKVKAGL